MNALELRAAIRTRTLEAAQKQIWQKAHSIAIEYGKPQFGERRNDETVYTFEIIIKGKRLKIKKHWAPAVDVTDTLKIFVDGLCVFDAQEVENDPDAYQYCTMRDWWDIAVVPIEVRTVSYNKKSHIYIRTYCPGEWEKWLERSEVINARRAEQEKNEKEKKHQKQERERTALELERTRPLTLGERDLAERFGIQL